MARNSKAQMVLAKGSKGNFLNNVLVDGSWHFDFLNDGLGIGNLQMKITIPFTKMWNNITYSELSRKLAANLILFEKFFPTTCLLRTSTSWLFTQLFLQIYLQFSVLMPKLYRNVLTETPRLFISEKKILPAQLIQHFGKISYLHVISKCMLIREVRVRNNCLKI